jgi:hypothetical protein
MSQFGSAFSLSVTGSSSFDSTVFARSFACPGSALSACDYTALGSFLFPKGFVRAGSSLFGSGTARMGFCTSLFDCVHVELSLLLQSFSHPGFPILPLGMSFSDFSPLPRSFSCLDSAIPICEVTYIDFPMFLQQLT